jgi:hypothetical protein
MSDNVISFPTEQPPELLYGPFEEYRVVVDGRSIPKLTGRENGDTVDFTLDHRFGLTVPKELAHQVAWFVANAMAIGAGYSHLGAESKQKPFAPRIGQLGPAT